MENETNQLPGDSVSDSNGTTTAELKARFSAGSVPLDTDFAALIDMAECGRRAIGKSADQTNNTIGAGLQIAADSDAANKGKLSVKLGGGLQFDAGSIRVGAGSALYLGGNEVNVKVGVGAEIVNDSVSVKADKYIKVSSSGVRVDTDALLPRGMIMMFCGSTAPEGWHFCDGSKVTAADGTQVQLPDLRKRFVLGSQTLGDSAGSHKGGASWSDSGFQATTTTDACNVGVKDHLLTQHEMPVHKHEFIDSNKMLMSVVRSNSAWGGDKEATSHDYVYASYDTSKGDFTMSTAGWSEPIKFDVTDPKHGHTVTVNPPYYQLAYIMKV
ncbi:MULTISPECIES: tail fiber protein [unclassified Caballeronia]|uniref:tail fiber protein n=1 Tax=unclassified Caballeronia TaxID=2646786 RepID=UPI0028607332|nr:MULTISPECIES: tail fiber protein [unclassified Caballeronia]MDR5816431.1 tail fiber protein [Caballeronia sp. LZ033]MDR5823101.1 tail fiber protein [Caballeronia sp. LZ043]MDR5881229.1 tail fiber protein [Caballeronia sp. LZ032]